MFRAVIFDRMDSIEAETVKVELLDPVQRIMDDEFTDDFAPLGVIVHGVAPRGFMVIGERLGSVRRKIISIRAEVVVNNIKGSP